MIAKYGCDALRAYILFMAPPDKDLEWSYEGLEGMYRWLARVWRFVDRGRRGGGRPAAVWPPPATRRARRCTARCTASSAR